MSPITEQILLGWLVNPVLLGVGGGLMSVPIIIHLLNKRKFKVVDWAAMDFLFDADKKNRRRVRLENLLLLLLRCLAMLLLGLLLARPFVAGLTNSQFERVILLDDSLSMEVQSNNETAIDRAKRSLIELVRSFADNDSDDLVTLLLTSDPETRLIAAERVNGESLPGMIERIEAIETSELTANQGDALTELEKQVGQTKEHENVVVYVFTDLRVRDWGVPTEAGDGTQDTSPAGILRRIGEAAPSGCFLVDVGSEAKENLAVTSIRPTERLVAGQPITFEVEISNLGEVDVEQARVTFGVRDEAQQSKSIAVVKAGESIAVNFLHTFPREDFESAAAASLRRSAETRSYELVAEVSPASGVGTDQFVADSVRFFAGRVSGGKRVLLVDGAPALKSRDSETHYLRHALRQFPSKWTGVILETVTDTQFENLQLDGYEVIYLCNVAGMTTETVDRLEAWVRAGGGLIFYPGNLDENEFNLRFYRDGKGLAPLKLLAIEGDPTQESWATLEVNLDEKHPAFGEAVANVLSITKNVKVFNWWALEPPADASNARITKPLKVTSVEGEWIGYAEHNVGEGKVGMYSFPADADWNNLAGIAGYVQVLMVHEMLPHISDRMLAIDDVHVGDAIQLKVDINDYKRSAVLRRPNQAEVPIQAVRPDAALDGDHQDATAEADTSAETSDNPLGDTIEQFSYPQTSESGFYRLRLTRTGSQGEDDVLFAVNLDPSEGALARMDADKLEQNLGVENVTLVRGAEVTDQSIKAAQIEIWPWILVLVGGVLCLEQFLGWYFGKRR